VIFIFYLVIIFVEEKKYYKEKIHQFFCFIKKLKKEKH